MNSELESDVYYRIYGWRDLVKAMKAPQTWRKVMALAAYYQVDGFRSPAG